MFETRVCIPPELRRKDVSLFSPGRAGAGMPSEARLARLKAVALAAQSEPCDDGAIASVVLLDQIRKKAASLSDELEEAAAGLIVLRKASQVLRQLLDPSVRSAICTSAEPVSPSLTAYSEMTSSFVSRASGTQSSD
jgi:hypothetical protein